ncbi:MAG: S-methyl-5-thioribose-1-phosphate isomerase [Nitrospirae bacterium]|jgi:methylthioribose-1-phosphate isomerase|nr:S-methyl-5-thioribose-1-phosphate isomerase [Nitrospirota bacterium]MCL5284972.1 S-methyl-5-thioribose-1-phosphate isomerase [Nitrospirota bacterium]
MVEAIWTVRKENGNMEVHLIDQRHLPSREIVVECRSHGEMADAIREMVVRGAPAIGISAAFGIALGAQEFAGVRDPGEFMKKMETVERTLAATRPTAVNLFWALSRMRPLWETIASRAPEERTTTLFREAQAIKDDDIARNRKIGAFGQALLPQSAHVLTHCNAGALATGGYGTALGVIRGAVEAGKSVKVFADETRPYLQGARLTAYELAADNIPVTLITDSMAAMVMAQGKVNAVIVGADRIAANGDTANKIGTYGLAVLAREHGIPFYVAAPFSTIDPETPTGRTIPIEERSSREVTHSGEIRMAPEGISVFNPAFDVTPAKYITAIITEKGVFSPEELSRHLGRPGQ